MSQYQHTLAVVISSLPTDVSCLFHVCMRKRYDDRSFDVQEPRVSNSRIAERRDPEISLYMFWNRLDTFLRPGLYLRPDF